MRVIKLKAQVKAETGKVRVIRLSPQAQITESTARNHKDLSTGDIVSRLAVVSQCCKETTVAIAHHRAKLTELQMRLRADQAVSDGFERILNARR